MQFVTDRVYTFTGLMVGRVYLVVDDDGLSLIDTGMPPAADRILAQLRAAGYRPQDVRRILITHAHGDHIGGLPALKAATGAEVIALDVEQPYLAGQAVMPRPALAELDAFSRQLVARMPTAPLANPVPADRVVTAGESIPEALGGIVALHLPGHTPGHTGYWQPQRRILFGGDVAMAMLPGRLTLPFGMATSDMAENRRSIARVAALQPDVICLGHGAPLTAHAAADFEAFARRVAPH